MKLPEWTVEAINLTPLYRCEDQYQYFRSDAKLQVGILSLHPHLLSAPSPLGCRLRRTPSASISYCPFAA